MFTDPKRIHADIPGTVEGNPVFIYHRIFNADRSEMEDLEERYRAGKVGDREVKEKLAGALNNFLRPFRERMASYQNNPGLVDEIIWNGTLKMRQIAAETMREVREKMGINRVWQSLQ
jgi:tryptophanyl-tRNA synthetase